LKLRIRENTLRLRLGRSEVESFKQSGSISSRIKLTKSPLGSLVYELRHASVDSPELTFSNGKFTCTLPSKEVIAWENSEQVGIYHSIRIEEGYNLELILEKDFKCLIERSDDDEDGYPNPANQSQNQSTDDGN